jgi:hypothetical protein
MDFRETLLGIFLMFGSEWKNKDTLHEDVGTFINYNPSKSYGYLPKTIPPPLQRLSTHPAAQTPTL